MEALPPPFKPRFRGVLHQYAFFVALLAGPALVLLAATPRARVAAAVYAVALCALFGASALYHRVDWTERRRAWMRRLDHSMIFLLIAGTYTPFALLVFEGGIGDVVLVLVWTGAVGGILFSVVWNDAPKWAHVLVYLALGTIASVPLPQLASSAGTGAILLVGFGAVLYGIGAAVYAFRRPDPAPATFGYHEVFHVLVIAAALAHYVAIAVYALPQG